MFQKTAAYYDAVYSFKDYAWESGVLLDHIRRLKPTAESLLDVGCGTGMHIAFLRKQFYCEGVDADPTMIALAQARNPGMHGHVGSMQSFKLSRKFDVVTCLFSAIGYAASVEELRETLANMARHLNPDGLVIIEPWLDPKQYQPGRLSNVFVDNEDLKIARMNLSKLEGRNAVLEFHYLIGTPSGIFHESEIHTLTLFTDEEYRAAFEAAGFKVTLDPEGLTGRGLYFGRL